MTRGPTISAQPSAPTSQHFYIRKEVASKVLNHVDVTVGGRHCDLYDYLNEKREALQAWANRLDEMLSDPGGYNVVPLRGA